jgi:dTDP-4-dehydrorhamnose 3,5-epimerase
MLYKRAMSFEFTPAPLAGVVLIQPRVRADSRGFFFETFKASAFKAAGIPGRFVQENQSFSTLGVLRGIHFQTGGRAQGKLVRVLSGVIWDLAVDLRPNSPTHYRWFGCELSAQNRTMVYLPPGFGHATLTLSDAAEVLYQCTAEYSPEHEAGLRWDDPVLGVQWPAVPVPYTVSGKDEALPWLQGGRP